MRSIALAIEGMEEPAAVSVRDDRAHASSDEVFADRIAIISLVGERLARWWCGVEHDGQHSDVCGLPGCERENERTPFAVAQGMDPMTPLCDWA